MLVEFAVLLELVAAALVSVAVLVATGLVDEELAPVAIVLCWVEVVASAPAVAVLVEPDPPEEFESKRGELDPEPHAVLTSQVAAVISRKRRM
jgi:hypothetical protein